MNWRIIGIAIVVALAMLTFSNIVNYIVNNGFNELYGTAVFLLIIYITYWLCKKILK